jgi:hypothetical protein
MSFTPVRFLRRHPWLLLIALAVLLLPLGLRRSRPAGPTPELSGRWTMHWRGQAARVWFFADGTYNCGWRGPAPLKGHLWAGQWLVRDGVLHVREWPAHAPQRLRQWSVRLEPGHRAGPLDCGGWFELRPLGAEHEAPSLAVRPG